MKNKIGFKIPKVTATYKENKKISFRIKEGMGLIIVLSMLILTAAVIAFII